MVERLSYAVVGALLLALCDASGARAYCRTHTKDEAESDCPAACMTAGYALAWSTPDVTYVFNEKGFDGLSDADLRGVFERSFASWERVRCDGQVIGISAEAKSGTTTSLSGPPTSAGNENVIMHLDSAEWAKRGYSSMAFAITAVWYNPNNGEILGADMMFNGLMDPFVVCSDTGCNTRDEVTDLQNVATHEIGHLLGLSHSGVKDSTMWCDAESNEISKRDLAADDIAGVCAIYPPGRDGGSGSGSNTGVDDDGCQLGARTAPWGVAPLLGLLLMLRARRRRVG